MKKPGIIIVDDHKLFRSGLKYILEESNLYQVMAEASNGLEFLDLLRNFSPDLVILDINLPDASGWDVARWIEAAMSPIPIIVTSGIRASQRDMKHFEPKAFLSKPFGIRQLLALILQPQLVW